MRGDIIKGLVDQIEERADLVPKAYTEKLRERIKRTHRRQRGHS